TGESGIRLVADIGGPSDGPAVALLHGGGQTRHSWAGTWKYLAQHGWRAAAGDLRGHGDSEWVGDGDYPSGGFRTAVLATGERFSRPPVFVGASLGGISSMLAIGESDDQASVASGLVLVDIAHRMEEEGRDRVGAFMTAHLDGFATIEDAADAIAEYN